MHIQYIDKKVLSILGIGKDVNVQNLSISLRNEESKRLKQIITVPTVWFLG
jgi:hypothetical protein